MGKSYFMDNFPNMGELIKNKIDEQNLTKAELSRRLSIKQQTIYGYFFQESLQTRIVWNMSHVLKYNFFTDLINLMPKELQETNKTSFQETISAQQKEIEDLKKEIAIYKEILSKRV